MTETQSGTACRWKAVGRMPDGRLVMCKTENPQFTGSHREGALPIRLMRTPPSGGREPGRGGNRKTFAHFETYRV
jgi:hypothetical protein